ncbi:MAG TPA: hypothetical protein ENI94_06715 [Gammaproteobacteria bacterium]|nr:hypothetical protein [Gammaproteobacteria bacterium]
MNPTLSPIAPLRDRIKAAPPYWANDTIEAWDELAFQSMQEFVARAYWSDQASINVHRVVGTRHPDYGGRTWLNLLNEGKRMRLRLREHADNRSYYLDTARKKPTMDYVTFDGLDYYIGSEGNHRTCIARFDFHFHRLSTLHGVTVTHYDIDQELYRRYLALKALCRERRLPYRFAGQQRPLRREDTAGWKLDRFEVSLAVENNRTGERQQLDRGGAGRLLDELRGKSHRRWWRCWP